MSHIKEKYGYNATPVYFAYDFIDRNIKYAKDVLYSLCNIEGISYDDWFKHVENYINTRKLMEKL